jgi:serine/threonine protein kinase
VNSKRNSAPVRISPTRSSASSRSSRSPVWSTATYKPQNVILTRQGATLLDFNIASRVGDPVTTVSGTPPYRAPDVDYTKWDVSTDLFAVGVTLYELLCNGEHPYPGGRPMIGEDVRDPSSFRPDLPEQLHALLARACAPYRDQRFQTAHEMRSELTGIRAVT